MILGLPGELNAAFEAAETSVFVTVDGAGNPIATVARTVHDRSQGCFDLDTAVGVGDPHVAIVVGLRVMVALVQGTARPSGAMAVRVRPERVYHWPDGNLDAEPELYDAHLEEVRASHNQEPEHPHHGPVGAGTAWPDRLGAIGALERATGVLAVVGPDDFPFAVQVPITVEPDARRVRIDADPVGAPVEPGPAALLVVDGDGELLVRGDLLEDGGVLTLHPRDHV
jgi:hypothetical protein